MFVTQGPVDPESPLFVGRTAELKRMEAWVASVHCVGAVLGARQTGKTSLLLKLRHNLRDKYTFVFVDLEAVAGSEFDECVNYLATEIREQLAQKLVEEDLVVPRDSKEFLGFLVSCARATQVLRIVVLLDEVGALPFETAVRLSNTIRAVFTSRFVKPEYARFIFVIAGATDMLELTAGRNSPLRNVTESLYVGDLSASETDELVETMLGRGSPAEVHNTVHHWTAGHPYWTQLLGSALDGHDAVTESAVRSIVEQFLHTEDRNLPHVLGALEADQTLWNLIEPILAGTPISFNRSNRTIAKLELIGLLKNENGHCAIRNPIYQEALVRPPVRGSRFAARELRKLAERLLAAGDLDVMMRTVAEDIQRVLQNRSVVVLTRIADPRSFTVAAAVGVDDEATTTVRFRMDGRLGKDLVETVDPDTAELPEEEALQLRRLGIVLVVPVRLHDDTAALLCLGPKLAGDEYDNHDREFLEAVAELAAAGLERGQLRALERDAQKAWEIQQRLLPKEMPRVSGLQIAGCCRPARVVGGDYYDVLKLDDRAVAFCIGDVVGKGMPAALLMASLQAVVNALTADDVTPNALCKGVNEFISSHVRPGEFITFFYGMVRDSRSLVYTNAGHNPPILVRSGGDIVRLQEGGPVLGIFPESTYNEQELLLESGDRLVLFTDGVTEATNLDGEEFGDERLVALLGHAHDLDAETLQRTVIDSVTDFSGGLFRDDVTLLTLAVTR